MSSSRFILGVVFACTAATWAQVPQPANQNPASSVPSIRPDYQLGPNDQILIGVPQSQEINQRPFRIDADGFIDLPLVGRMRAGGLTVRGLEQTVAERLRDYIRDPVVSITMIQFRSEPVFFLGAFQKPGVYALQGGQTLVEMLAFIGGLQPNASRRIKVSRRSEYGPLPLPSAINDPDKKLATVEISLDSLTQNINPAEDIVLKAYDVVTVQTAQPIYINGEVLKPGPVPLGELESISITEALSQAGGLTPNANRGKAKVLRPILGTTKRAEIEVNVARIYDGKDNDFPLLPNDLLYVPRSTPRTVLTPLGTSILTSVPYVIIGLAVSGAL